MRYPTTWFKLRRSPCFECSGTGFTFLYPWVELLCDQPVSSVFLDCADAFLTGEEYQAVCPYCLSPDDDFRTLS
jgi:hypothetical protein